MIKSMTPHQQVFGGSTPQPTPQQQGQLDLATQNLSSAATLFGWRLNVAPDTPPATAKRVQANIDKGAQTANTAIEQSRADNAARNQQNNNQPCTPVHPDAFVLGGIESWMCSLFTATGVATDKPKDQNMTILLIAGGALLLLLVLRR